MKGEDTPRVYLYIWICLLSNNVFVLTAPSDLSLIDTIESLRDKKSMKEKGVNHIGNLYKSLQRERINRLLSSVDRHRDAQLGGSQTQNNVERKAFKHGTSLHDNSNNIGTWYDFAVRASNEDAVDSNGTGNEKLNKVINYTGKGPREFETKREEGEQITDTALNLGAMENDPYTEETVEEVMQPADKRQDVTCDLSQLTLNMLVEYFRNRTLCGRRTSQIRFGLGK